MNMTIEKKPKRGPQASGWNNWKKSSTCREYIKKSKEIEKDPEFKKERLKLPKPYADTSKVFKRWPRKVMIYPDEWEVFCKKWDIDMDQFISHGKVILNLPEKIKGNIETFRPTYEPQRALSRKEYTDIGFLHRIVEEDFFDKPKGSGREPGQDEKKKSRNKKIRKLFKKRSKNILATDFINGLHKKYPNLSYSYFEKICRSAKND